MENILIVGGTHGNELTGVELVKLWQKNPLPHSDLNISYLLANPRAIASDRRYIEKDLNRCFSQEILNSKSKISEENRARGINEKFGPKGSDSAPDFIIDIHNTTANMGLSLIFGKKSDFILQLCAHMQTLFPNVYPYFMEENLESAPYLPTIGKQDLCIEVGAQAHGTLNSDLFIQTKKLVLEVLQFCQLWRINAAPKSAEVTIFEQWKNVDYPRDEQEQATAFIHPSLQFKDYQVLKPGAPLFITPDEETLFNPETEDSYPVFINEHAYYEKGIALSLTRKRTITL